MYFPNRKTCYPGYAISAQTAPPSGKREHPEPWLDPVRESAIDRLFSRPPNSRGYAVALIKDDEFVFANGYGLANLDDGIPITRMTSFHLASLSKQFTAAGLEVWKRIAH
jgi:CubicO group peptidase (beta-lactamase class C family)